MDPAEVEFLAEQELVTIIPNFSLDRIYLIGVGGWKKKGPRGGWMKGGLFSVDKAFLGANGGEDMSG